MEPLEWFNYFAPQFLQELELELERDCAEAESCVPGCTDTCMGIWVLVIGYFDTCRFLNEHLILDFLNITEPLLVDLALGMETKIQKYFEI